MSVQTSLPAVPPSPGVGARRKGPKSLPKLPLSAFSPPNSGTGEQFPLPPSPSTVHPATVIDAHCPALDAAGSSTAVVLAPAPADVQAALDQLKSSPPSAPRVLSVLVPYSSDAVAQASGLSVPVGYKLAYKGNDPSEVQTLREALAAGKSVDIGVGLEQGDASLDALEDLLTQATADPATSTKIVLSGTLPPPHDLSLPIVKLLTHPSYRDYQAHCASLSLIANVFIKFLPPAWDAPTPHSAPPTANGDSAPAAESKEKKEWKRRIKMYLGPAIEAFGYERIIYGSGSGSGGARDWYEIARESLAELGVEQDAIDAVFGGNAMSVYGQA